MNTQLHNRPKILDRTAPQPPPAFPDGVRIYRGESLDRVLVQVRADLGPHAIVLKQREGLTGGVAGFFQKRCVEVEARAGKPRVDVFDEPPAPDQPPLRNDRATAEGLASPAVQTMVEQAQPFADLLDDLGVETELSGAPLPGIEAPGLAGEPAVDFLPETDFAFEWQELAAEQEEPEPELLPEPELEPEALPQPEALMEPEPPAELEPEPPVERPKRAAELMAGLESAGLGADIATTLVDSIACHSLPFATPARLRTLVRDELALRIPVAPLPPTGGRSIAIVGPAGAGKTAAVARIAAAYAAHGTLDVVCATLAPADGGASVMALLEGCGVEVLACDTASDMRKLIGDRMGEALVVIDTPAVTAGSDTATAALAKELRRLRPDETHMALRAGTSAAAASELAAGLAPLRPNRLLLTHAGETAHLGPVADLAIRADLALGFVSEHPGELAPADARALAQRITP